MEYTRCTHEFGPFYREDSEILILGSFPSVKSREQKFYYGHPQNRFWRMLADTFGEKTPGSQEEKETLLEAHQIALWDVIEACDIKGSSDSSIRSVLPTQLEIILSAAPIRLICANGKLAGRLLGLYHGEYLLKYHPQIQVRILPSTSPANAACRMEQLMESWKEALLSSEAC